jgi:glyoxylate/hydroxypyruvate reductase A
MAIVFKSDPVRGAEWKTLLAEQAPDLPFTIWPELGDPATVRYLVAWDVPDDVLTLFPNLQLIFATGAGVDHLDFAKLPAGIPVVRMVEPGITNGMVEYVTLAVLAAHRHLVDYIALQQQAKWAPVRVLAANRRRVGIMGFGVLGKAVLGALKPFGFRLSAWSRSGGSLDGVDCHAGPKELPRFLADCDILVCLLPLTSATRGILDAKLFAALPAGTTVINASRGPMLVDADLLAALDSGHLGGAVLDVFDPEPLPSDHPFWSHPRILMTPHIATMTQPETAALVVLDAIRRHQRGEPIDNVIDPRRGY